MGIAATILFAVVVVVVLYATMRKPKAEPTDDQPASPQGNGGPLNPEK